MIIDAHAPSVLYNAEGEPVNFSSYRLWEILVNIRELHSYIHDFEKAVGDEKRKPAQMILKCTRILRERIPIEIRGGATSPGPSGVSDKELGELEEMCKTALPSQ
ncbi:MAG: hypothetical protein NTW17_03495 [Candidatus Pacearchaeota archaeon]|nr:hypothetical protein [Candidatus Pacearchaeota archaeon]